MKRDDAAIAVVRNIIALHEGTAEVLIDDAGKLVREFADREARAAAAAEIGERVREIERVAAADLALKTDAAVMAGSPEEIRGRLLDWLQQSSRRRVSFTHREGLWDVALAEQPEGRHAYYVVANGHRPNHLDAIEVALNEASR